MIQNERQYKVTQTKLRELEQVSASVELEDPNLHPRQILSQKNSYNQIISTLKQEIAEYEELKSGRIAVFRIESFNELKYRSSSDYYH